MMPSTLDIRVDDSQREYFTYSSSVARSFQSSPLEGLAARIMAAPGSQEFEPMRLGSGSRKVYRIGGFEHAGSTRHAILKFDADRCSPASPEYTLHALFEGFMFSVVRRFTNDMTVLTPDFCFGVDYKGRRGVVMEDVSQGGRLEVTMFQDDERCPFATDPAYMWDRRQALRVLSKRLMWLDMLCSWSYDMAINANMGRLADQHQETMIAVVHDGASPKGMYLVDADQVWTCKGTAVMYGVVWHRMIEHEIKSGMRPTPLISLQEKKETENPTGQ